MAILHWKQGLLCDKTRISFHFTSGLNSEGTPSEKAANVLSEIRALNEIIAKFKSLQVDATEYACLKGIVLFKTGEFSACLSDTKPQNLG